MNLKFLADVNIEKCIVDLVTRLRYDIRWTAVIDKSTDDEEWLKI